MVQPPSGRAEALLGVVRGSSDQESDAIGSLLDALGPQVTALVPGAALPPGLEVWVQDEPRVYSLPGAGVDDAEGLWSARHQRILLARDAEDLERTLAHELVHAALDETWGRLPGTVEEGLCDLVSAQLCSDGATRLRAGRLCSAALACGGLAVELRLTRNDHGGHWLARVSLSGEVAGDAPQRAVFEVEAGLSSTALTTGTKRGFYGLAFLLVQRAEQRVGLQGLRELCERAEAQDLEHVPTAWLLEAAALEDDRAHWQAAAVRALDDAALLELVHMYPSFAVDAVEGWLEGEDLSQGWPEGTRIEVRTLEGDALVDLTEDDRLLELVLEARRAESQAPSRE